MLSSRRQYTSVTAILDNSHVLIIADAGGKDHAVAGMDHGDSIGSRKSIRRRKSRDSEVGMLGLTSRAMYEAFKGLRRDASEGVGGVTFQDYQKELGRNLIYTHAVLTNREIEMLRWIWIIQALTGFLLLALAWHTGKTHSPLVTTGERTQGKLVGYEEARFGTRGPGGVFHVNRSFMPVVEFQAGNRVVRFTDWRGSSSAGGINDSVTVLYDAANPSVAMIDRRVWNWIPWGPFFAVGSFLVIVAIKGRYAPRNRAPAS